MNAMITEPMPLWGQAPPRASTRAALADHWLLARPYYWRKAREIPALVPFLVAAYQPSPVVIVAPGGGYHARAAHEGAPVARWLNSMGVSAFVLNYRHAPHRFPVPFLDAQRAVRVLRHGAAGYTIDPARVGMIGFSAGGHLTSMTGTLRGRDWFPRDYHRDAIDGERDTLDCMILCYPVIDMGPRAHEGCRRNLLGKHPDPALVSLLSTQDRVDGLTPPTFIWTTRTDQTVPCEHSLAFAEALARNGIEHEIHVYEHGSHGLGLARGVPGVESWTRSCQDWLKKRGFIPGT